MLVRVSPFEGLEELREDALARIDRTALDVVGEDGFRCEHEAALAQAVLILHDGSSVSGAKTDLLDPEVAMGRAADVREAAKLVLHRADESAARMVRVREVRLRIKQAIRQAQTRDEVVSLRNAGVLELQYLEKAATSKGRAGCE